MGTVTRQSESLRAAIVPSRRLMILPLRGNEPTDLRPVARGMPRLDSDIDLMVDLLPRRGNELLRVSGIAEELSEVLGTRVDVGSRRRQAARRGVLDGARGSGASVSRSQEERFADIRNAIRRCNDYAPFLRSDDLASMAYDALLLQPRRSARQCGAAERNPESMPEVSWAAIAGRQRRRARVLPREPRDPRHRRPCARRIGPIDRQPLTHSGLRHYVGSQPGCADNCPTTLTR